MTDTRTDTDTPESLREEFGWNWDMMCREHADRFGFQRKYDAIRMIEHGKKVMKREAEWLLGLVNNSK